MTKRLVSFGLFVLLMAMAIGVFINGRWPPVTAEIRPEVAPPPLQYTDDKGAMQPLVDMSGKPVRLEDYRGKAVFINFWATWCRPCR